MYVYRRMCLDYVNTYIYMHIYIYIYIYSLIYVCVRELDSEYVCVSKPTYLTGYETFAIQIEKPNSGK